MLLLPPTGTKRYYTEKKQHLFYNVSKPILFHFQEINIYISEKLQKQKNC